MDLRSKMRWESGGGYTITAKAGSDAKGCMREERM